MDGIAMLRTFYEAYGAYFGDDTPVVVTLQGMDAPDRATLAGLRAVVAQADRNPKGEKPQALSAKHESPVGEADAPKTCPGE